MKWHDYIQYCQPLKSNVFYLYNMEPSDSGEFCMGSQKLGIYSTEGTHTHVDSATGTFHQPSGGLESCRHPGQSGGAPDHVKGTQATPVAVSISDCTLMRLSCQHHQILIFPL